MISFLFYFFLLYFAYKLLVSGWVGSFTRVYKTNHKPQQEPNRPDSTAQNKTRSNKTQLGEYVDFEEIKE